MDDFLRVLKDEQLAELIEDCKRTTATRQETFFGVLTTILRLSLLSEVERRRKQGGAVRAA